ncbi:MAG: Gfo/Idh/MocA family oxidoreductase [Acidobacteriota bacterium]|nr:Gfo/Idh/MocA family oxidoreductase [Acidobacteriota bacterium]
MAVTRRKFVKTASTAGAGLLVLPRHVLGRGFQAPSDLVNIATVGVNGMGRVNTRNLASHNIVAFCDVDATLMENSIAGFARDLEREKKNRDDAVAKGETARAERFTKVIGDVDRMVNVHTPRLQRYADYRVMLEKQKDIDAVVIATPDHMHAPIAMAAMQAGKHVYVQKPLCWAVSEARALGKLAAENPKLMTQMGNQGHSADDARLGYEYVTSGAIGDVREVHVWTNRPLAYWPQGLPRPAGPLPDNPQRPLRWDVSGVDRRLAAAMGLSGVPDGLDWNLFLGVAPDVPYHPIYHPFNWRGWVDWGQGALGDMGAHLIDHPFWSLDLGMPTVIETVSTPFNKASYPLATTTHYEFPARGSKPSVKLTWYDGNMTPPRPEELGEEKLNGEGGILFIGSKGKMLQDTYGLRPRLLPKARHDATPAPAQTLPRIPGGMNGHEINWAESIQGKQKPSSPIEFAARLTEVMLLGIVALRAGTKIHYDAASMRVTNNEAANQLLTREYRTGW